MSCQGEVNPPRLARALGDIARARGMSQVARDAGLSRESLSKASSENSFKDSSFEDSDPMNTRSPRTAAVGSRALARRAWAGANRHLGRGRITRVGLMRDVTVAAGAFGRAADFAFARQERLQSRFPGAAQRVAQDRAYKFKAPN